MTSVPTSDSQDETNPQVFIEVRKSSSRHASLYAKDKMFSAINWKGRHPGLMGVLVTDGEWTGANAASAASSAPLRGSDHPKASDACGHPQGVHRRGQDSKLKWLINFSIEANSQTEIRLSRSKSARPNGSGESGMLGQDFSPSVRWRCALRGLPARSRESTSSPLQSSALRSVRRASRGVSVSEMCQRRSACHI